MKSISVFTMKPQSFTTLAIACLIASPVLAAEFHVSPNGNDAAAGSAAKPFKTISAAAQKAMPGDSVTVHAGTYRERINPPRGGTSPSQRITYQAAKGEKVVITGSDSFTSWEKVSGDTWKLVLPSSYFGSFNPYAEKVHGDWFTGQGRTHRRGNVYLNGEWLAESPNQAAVMRAAGAKPMWFSVVDGLADDSGPQYLMNLLTLKAGTGAAVTAS